MANPKEQELAKQLVAIAKAVQPKIRVVGSEIQIDYQGSVVKLSGGANQLISDRLSFFR